MIAILLCRAWEEIAWRSRKRHRHVPWTSEQLADYFTALDRYTLQSATREETGR